jgi:23S rRNA pseudouridine1911/1915/1917 synthase
MLFTVTQEKIRLDIFLAEVLSVTRSRVKAALAVSPAVVNGVSRDKSGFELKRGDAVEFSLPPERALDLKPLDLPLEIVYQDDFLAVINKPQGMVVHPAPSYKGGTLVNALLYNLDNLSTINGVFRPGIVHRLDKNTSGLLVVAKCDAAHKSLAAQIKDKTASRVYLGIVDGVIKEDKGEVDAAISRDRRDRKKMAAGQTGRAACTRYRVLERFKNHTYVEFELTTGRTHQIRVHMKHINHPLAGDDVYGGSQTLAKGGQLLHAARLSFMHPQSGEKMTFEAPPPQKFQKILNSLRNSR